MSKPVRSALLLLSSICLAAIIFAGCKGQDEPAKPEKTVEAGKSETTVEAGGPAPTAPPASPVSSAPAAATVPPGHPAIPGPTAHPAVPAPDLKTLPRVSLSEIEVGESEDGAVTRITITGGGTFVSNVIRKEDPERIILLIHNAEAGELAGSIEVNNGTVGRIEVAQLESGQGPAVRVTVGLAGKSDFRVVPAENALAVDVRRQQLGEVQR